MPHLNDGDVVLAVWAESCNGPGWSNQPMWLLIRARNGALRIECLQPHEQGEGLRTLHKPAAAMHESLTREAIYLLRAKQHEPPKEARPLHDDHRAAEALPMGMP